MSNKKYKQLHFNLCTQSNDEHQIIQITEQINIQTTLSCII